MKIFLLTDLEGIPGVTTIEQMERDSLPNLRARELLGEWINKTAAYCREFGADTIYYLDGHGGGKNVSPEQIDPSLIKCSITDWVDLLKRGEIDAQIELGAHARAGTIGGFLDHTLSSKSWFRYTVGGVEYSELALHAAMCGIYNVPIIACIGDVVACEQAKEYIPEIVTGAVKMASCRNLCTDFPNAEEIIRETVKKALEGYREIPPMKVSLPSDVELTYYRTDMCEKALSRAKGPVERVDARTLRKTVDRIETYEDLKF